ncbi:uncharacterized protein LOC133723072 [Rosa rugosa]|uniref:uncharacterized protein LOC133723072 n=1 Tax=Rosa rugosa TaxID=74645 RepID=UPI002B40E21B|nr:uncharacterized protein LOC133723072 [Rosa rugosa]
MIILSWNVRGLGNPSTFNALKKLLRVQDPDLVFLMETKKKEDAMARLCSSLGYNNYKIVDRTREKGGGLALLWKDGLTVEVVDSSPGFIDGIVLCNGKRLRVTGFYGHPTTGERHHSWEVIRRLAHSLTTDDWIIFGDFNEILRDEEKSVGRLRPMCQMERFGEVVNECGFKEVEFTGPTFTWSNGTIAERLDRGFLNPTATISYPNAHVFHLEETWEMKASDSLYSKLQFCAERLQEWNSKVVGHIPRKIAALKTLLQNFPIDACSEADRRQRKVIKHEIEKYAEYEESLWKQKSRIQWLQEGDQNTKYFHAVAKGRGQQNKIQGVCDETGAWCEDMEAIQNAFVTYFSNLYISEGCNNLELVLDTIPRRVTEEVNSKLLGRFERWEVELALKHMGATKSPGLDGMSALFFKSFWPVVGDAVCEFCLGVLNDGKELEEFNHTLISLIPKISNPKSVTEFRPISLCSTVYKFISKTLANRLKKHLPDIISSTQSAFVPGRNIQDNVIAAFETVHSIRIKKTTQEPKMVLKLDISKAYDRVEWLFLEEVMKKLGFANRWVSLVMKCVQSVSFSILWKGQPVGHFTPTRGIRQGGPLSPYLFLLVSEGLSGLLHRADEVGMIHGVKVAPSAPSISHLLFADDSLLFVNANIQDCISLKQCLLLYESAAGQRINFQKSALSFGPNVPENLQVELQEFLNVPVVDFHEKYLGLPTSIGRNKTDVFRKLNERLDRQLQGWQGKFLSKAGKLVLIKAVAQAIPTYSMLVFQLPIGVCKKFQSKVSKFWWGKSGGVRGIHWSSWERLCTSKEAGGLGVRDLRAFNQSMLAKTVWRIFWGRSSLVLDQGTRWRIGNGRRVRIKGDRWLPTPSSFKVISSLPIPDAWTVEHLLTESGAWNVPLIQSLFLAHEAETILAMPLGLRSIPDKLVWHFTKNGNFTVKTGYWVARALQEKKNGSIAGCSTSRVPEVWKKVWKLHVPSKINLLLWRAFHNFLPCGQNLQQRRITMDGTCWQCGAACESTLHVFWECPAARNVWKLTFLSEVCKTWKEPSVMDLFSHVSSIAVGNDLALFGFIIWWLWRNRNLQRHGEKTMHSEGLVQAATEWQLQFCSAIAQTPPTRLHEGSTYQEVVNWNTPARGFLKMNFDGATDVKNGVSGIGAVFRDHEGTLKGAVAAPLVGNISPRAVESLALLHGLRYALHVGFTKLEVEGDALTVLNTLHDKHDDLSSEGHILDEVKQLFQFFSFCSWHFVRRDCNKVAHRLAKEALQLSHPFVCLESGPIWLHQCVSIDFECEV